MEPEMTDDAMIQYTIEVVGGPYDGEGGMRWHDDGEHPPPEMILLGTCPGDGSCGSMEHERCARRKRKHTYFWLPEETTRPLKVACYELADHYLTEVKRLSRVQHPGKAIYTIGGLRLPAGPAERELVSAGAGQAPDPSRGVKVGGFANEQ